MLLTQEPVLRMMTWANYFPSLASFTGPLI